MCPTSSYARGLPRAGPLFLLPLPILLPLLFAAPAPLEAQADERDVAPAPPDLPPPSSSLPSPPTHDLTRTVVELGGTFGVLAALYFVDGRTRQLDRSVAEGLGMLFSPARLRFDDNSFYINNVLHPLEGLAFYGIPRANGASAPASFLTMTGASVLWEQVVELQEVASINDHIVTPIAGFAFGEALFQTREVFRRAEPTLRNRVMRALFGLPVSSTEVLVARAPPSRTADEGGGSPGERDTPENPPSDVRLHLGLRGGAEVRSAGPALELGLSSEVFRGSSGSGPGSVHGSAFTELDARLVLTDDGAAQVHAFARVVPAQWSFGSDSRRLAVGPSVAFDAQMRGGQDGRGSLNERVFAGSLLGATADARINLGRGIGHEASARLVLDLFANFSSTSALGWPEERSRGEESSVFLARGYYYGYGSSTRAAASLSLGAIELEGERTRHEVRSIHARDRHPELARDPAAKRDRWTSASASIGWRHGPGLRWAAGIERQSWNGRIEDAGRHEGATTWFARAAWTP